VRRGDNACQAYPDFDFAELLYEVEDEFGIKLPDEVLKSMVGTFDGIVRYVALQRQTPG
jgi:acyl carrier protein